MSFSKGAKVLNVTPAAVSSQIRALEERLNQPLFRRQGRQVSLTAAGRKLLPGIQRGLAELRTAVQTLDTERSAGALNVSMVPTFLQKWLMPRLTDFASEQPEIDLRISADTQVVDFESSDFHIAIRFGPGNWPDLRSELLLPDWILPVCSPALAQQIGPIETLEQLQQHNLLYVESDVWDAWFRVAGDQARDKRWALLNDSLAILMAAEQGEGIALTRWSLVARDIANGRLVRPIDTAVRTDWSYYFVAPEHFWDMPKVSLFRQWLHQQCARFEQPEP